MWCGQDILFFWVWADFFTVVLTMGCQHCWANGFFGSLSFLLTNKYACLLAAFRPVLSFLQPCYLHLITFKYDEVIDILARQPNDLLVLKNVCITYRSKTSLIENNGWVRLHFVDEKAKVDAAYFVGCLFPKLVEYCHQLLPGVFIF